MPDPVWALLNKICISLFPALYLSLCEKQSIGVGRYFHIAARWFVSVLPRSLPPPSFISVSRAIAAKDRFLLTANERSGDAARGVGRVSHARAYNDLPLRRTANGRKRASYCRS